MKKWLICLCLLMMMVLLASCASQLDPENKSKNPSSAPAAQTNFEVVGSINGQDVYRYEYEYYFNNSFNQNFSQYYEALIQYEGVDLLIEESAHDFLGDMEFYAWQSVVQANLIRQKALEEYDISIEPSYYDNLLTPDTVLSINTNRLYMMIFPKMEEETKAAKGVDDEEAKAYYNEDPSSWDCRKVAHIIVTGEQMMDEAVENEQELTEEEAHEAAKQRAEEIIAKLAAGEDFAELAAQYSADGTAAIGGEMDLYFNSYGAGINEDGSFDPLFADGAFILNNINDTSKEPIESSFGFHIIKLLDKKEGFDAVKSYVLESMLTVDQQEISEYFGMKLEGWENDAVVERNFDFIYYIEPPEGELDDIIE
ncbi:MAG: peptidylprolyl isomerase [Clostridiales bacterium]|nr:peptidylprolyl isomerase [Clostridiales bacterium]